tara:strand:- start:18021 stop:18575 length:555 start_codon:yes stop_codon:yes gene_type:complete
MNYINSSYQKNNFDSVFKEICEKTNPKSILEIGILDGYSLNSFIKHTSIDCEILAIDLFEDYQYKNSNFEKITNKFKRYPNVTIDYGDFYSFAKSSKKFDIIHIDISNDAAVYKFALEHYFPLTNHIMILEGGSIERDNVSWMVDFNKPKINTFLQTLEKRYDYQVIDMFPSVTVFYQRDKNIS